MSASTGPMDINSGLIGLRLGPVIWAQDEGEASSTSEPLPSNPKLSCSFWPTDEILTCPAPEAHGFSRLIPSRGPNLSAVSAGTRVEHDANHTLKILSMCCS